MPTSGPRPLALAVSTHASRFAAVTQTDDLAAQLAELAAIGFDGVELAIRDPSLVDADELVELVERHGLRVPAISTGQAYVEEGLLLTSSSPDVRRAALQRVLSHLPLAAKMNAAVIVGLIGIASADGQPLERALALLGESLRTICSVATDVGVRVVVEPVNRYESEVVRTVEDGLRLLDAVDATNLGLLLDTFHMNIEEPSIPNSIKRCETKLFHFHLADSNRWHPGAGHIDFEAVLTALDGACYDGFLSGEFLPQPNSTVAATAFFDTMTALTESTP